MIKRTIEISLQPVHLTVKDRQLVLLAKSDSREILCTAPCEDVGILLVEEQGVTYTHAALVTLIEHEAAVILCGRDHLPAGLLLPMADHSQVVWRIHSQLAVKLPVKKRLWQQIIRAKIHAQALNLPDGSDTQSRLRALARRVRSGDPNNLEAQAARAYWTSWLTHLPRPLTTPFRRDPDGAPPNNLLNYGYAVMRAAVARAIVAAGLLPVLGLKHSNRSNAFCLADDLVEPLRPLVDRVVQSLVGSGESQVNPQSKRELLALLAADVRYADQTGPLMVALNRYAASLVKCFEGDAAELEIPTTCM